MNSNMTHVGNYVSNRPTILSCNHIGNQMKVKSMNLFRTILIFI